MTMSEVFLFLLSRLEQGDLLTRMKNKTRSLLVEIWGKVNWDKRWQGSIFNELASKCAKRTTSFNHRKHYVDSLLLRFQRMLLLAWKELKYVSISYILLFFEDVPQLFFCKYQKLRARDCIFKSQSCSQNNEKVARSILYYCCAHGLFKKNAGSGFDLGDNFCLTWNICFLSYGNILTKQRFDPSLKW